MTALLALEHHELISAEELTEQLLAMLADTGEASVQLHVPGGPGAHLGGWR